MFVYLFFYQALYYENLLNGIISGFIFLKIIFLRENKKLKLKLFQWSYLASIF